LDALGRERGVYRLSSEADSAYRARIVTMADVVSPMAIMRAIISILLPYGMTGRLLEVGTPSFPGFFYDVDADIARPPPLGLGLPFAYDFDLTLRPTNRWSCYLSLYEMRAFFLVAIVNSDLGDFGFAWDNHPTGAFDAASYNDFFDGWAIIAAAARRKLWDDISKRKAAGVSFDFVEVQP
jgi:hypothetical protein